MFGHNHPSNSYNKSQLLYKEHTSIPCYKATMNVALLVTLCWINSDVLKGYVVGPQRKGDALANYEG